ncbi:MAG TPA: type II secretion system F family protein [Candidatus Nanopelagicaceae bacterium]|nr:type II secretion system F family protein [Candidatus Nanopelagicaceae bacterium]
MKRRANLAALAVACFAVLQFQAPLSFLAALLGGWVTKRAIAKLEPAAIRDERLRLVYLAPEFAELIALCLDSGLPLLDSIAAAGEVIGSPVRRFANESVALMQMGADAQQVFKSWRDVPALTSIAITVQSSIATGSSAANALRRTALRLRRARASQVRRQVRSVGVRATLPIGLCFLPSFVLGAVFPIAAQVLYSLLGSLPPVFFSTH